MTESRKYDWRSQKTLIYAKKKGLDAQAKHWSLIFQANKWKQMEGKTNRNNWEAVVRRGKRDFKFIALKQERMI